MRGACLCQQVRFEVNPPSARASHCHCRSCRLAHGAAFVTWSSVPRARFRVREGADSLAVYTSSPGVRRMFCRRCGSPMLYECDSEPEIIYFTVAHVDGPLTTPVERHFSYEEHVPWIEGADALPRYRGKTDEPV